MLSNARLFRSRTVTTALRSTIEATSFSRPVVHKILIRRQQHTESTAATINSSNNVEQQESQSFNDKSSEQLKQNDFIKSKNSRPNPFIDIETEFITKLKNGESVREVHSKLISKLNDIDERSRSSFDGRKSFGKIFNILMASSLRETNELNIITITPYDILTSAIELNCADVINFDYVAKLEYSQGNLQEVISLWVSFLEYSRKLNLKIIAKQLKELTLLSYVESCVIDNKNPNIETALALLQMDNMFNGKELHRILNKYLKNNNDDAAAAATANKKRYQSIKPGIESLRLGNKDPNSLIFLEKANLGAELKKIYMIDEAYKEALKTVEITGKKLNEDTLIQFMKFYNKVGQYKTSMEFWNKIIKSGIKPSINAWNSLLETVSNLGPYPNRLLNSQIIFDKISNKNDETYGKMIIIYNKFNQFEKINSIIPKEIINKPYISKIIVQILLSKNKLDEALKLINENIYSKGLKLNLSTYNLIIFSMIKFKKFNEAKKILSEMIQNGIKPDVITYTSLLDMTFKETRKKGEIISDDLISSFLEEMRLNGIEPNFITISSIIDGLGKDSSHIDSAIKLFDYVKKNNLASPPVYTSIISNLFNLGESKKAEMFFKNFIESGYKLTISNWNLMFEGFMKNGNANKSLEYYNLLKKISEENLPKLNVYSIYFLLKVAKFRKNIELANLVLQDQEKIGFNNFSKPLKKVLEELEKIDDVIIPPSFQQALKEESI